MKLTVSHTQKIPCPEEYSSQGYGCTLEFEVPDEAARESDTLRGYIRELYTEASPPSLDHCAR